MTETKQGQPSRGPLKSVKLGTVVSDARDKTRKVVVDYRQRHPKYGKYVRHRSTFHVHDESNESRNGDRVLIAPCRPISKTKAWRLVEVVEQAPREGVKAG